MKVLFICSGNAHRSPLAEALLRKLKPNWTVDSAGISVAIPIAEEIKEYLQGEDALEYLKSKPESVNSKQLMKYDLIIAMEDKHKEYVLSLCPECRDKIKVWNVKRPILHGQRKRMENIRANKRKDHRDG